jgi:integrase/recombinase XerD
MSTKNKIDIVSSKGVQKNLVYLYLAEVNQCSRYTYLFALNKVARKIGAPDAYSFDWSQLRNEHTTMIKRWLLETGKASSAHKTLAAVKGILEKAFDLELISADDYLRAIKPCKVKVNKQLRAATGRMLEQREIDALLETCKKGAPARSARDAAIISIFAQVGTRLAEVSNLNFADYVPDFTKDDEGKWTGRLICHGKGSKDRTLYIKNGTRAALNRWIEIRGNEPGPLFYTILKGDQPFARRVCPSSIWNMLKVRGKHAGLAHFTPHDLRRSFASRLLDEGVDISTIADLMGHTDPSITKGYDRRGEARKMDAIA